jgi:uncharacterized membrane protein YkvA (DUF1232 family)
MTKYIWAFLALLYLISPRDMIPDGLGLLGYLDDLIIIYILVRYWIRHAKWQQAAGHSQHGQQRKEDHQKENDFSSADTDSAYQASKDPYRVLGIGPNATQAEIRQAYRKLANQYHPDKVSHLGQEFVKLSEKRFKEIQNAYQILKKDK